MGFADGRKSKQIVSLMPFNIRLLNTRVYGMNYIEKSSDSHTHATLCHNVMMWTPHDNVIVLIVFQFLNDTSSLSPPAIPTEFSTLFVPMINEDRCSSLHESIDSSLCRDSCVGGFQIQLLV